MKLSNILPYFMLCTLLFVSACATMSSYDTLQEQEIETEPEKEVMVPAGVDSVIAAESRNLADSSFVAYQQEQKAQQLVEQANAYKAESDTLWHYLTLEDPDQYEVTEEDDREAITSFNEGAEMYSELNQLSEETDMEQAELETRHEELLDKSIEAFEEALSLNPFDNQTRLILGQLYGVKANRLNRNQEHEKAIDTLEKLARVEKGEHFIYASLAENYFSVNNYKLASENFDRASSTLLETAQLTDFYDEHGTISPQDSSNAFVYSFYRGRAFVEMLEPDNALESLEQARQYTSSETDLEAVQSEVDFVEWDNGNILGSMRRDSLIALVNHNELQQAEEGYAELKQNLQTPTAYDEVDWRLAVVQYQIGEQQDYMAKKEEGAERLLELYERTELDEEGNPVDERYERYVNDFGIITYNIGLEHQNNRNRSTALKYYNQSAKVNWDNRARTNLRIADLLSNNIPEAIRYANLAEEEIESMSQEDQRALYELLTDLYRRNGNIEIAREYRDRWREI